MRVLLAPDSFKGSLSAGAAARAMAAGLRTALPHVDCIVRPLADGGEGTLAALAAALPGQERVHPVTGPHGEPLMAGWWQADAGWGVVEMARASGLGVTPRRDPLRATTAGTGGLLAQAARTPGLTALKLAVGGSATVDGGVGALAALGFRFLDGADADLPARPDAMHRLARVVPPAQLPPRLAELEVLCDVDSPLLGAEGAAAVFGPQKGADAEAVGRLEAGLARWAAVARATFGRAADVPYGGAAGGLAGGLHAALGARLVPGFPIIADAVGLDQALAGAALVLTGEGRLDGQTARGKVVAGLAQRAQRVGVPVWAFAGQITADGEAWCAGQGVAVAALADGPRSLEDSVASAAVLLERAVRRACLFGAWQRPGQQRAHGEDGEDVHRVQGQQ